MPMSTLSTHTVRTWISVIIMGATLAACQPQPAAEVIPTATLAPLVTLTPRATAAESICMLIELLTMAHG